MMNLELFIRALLFYLIPLSWGSLLFVVSNKIFQKNESHTVPSALPNRLLSLLTGNNQFQPDYSENDRFIALVTQATVRFALGVISLLIWGLLCAFLQTFIPNSFNILFFGVSYLVFFTMLIPFIIRLTRSLLSVKTEHTKYLLQTVLALIGIGITASLLWSRTTAGPLNWDLYEHQTLSTIIQHGSFSFFTSQLSDTFGFMSYPPTFHALLAVSQFGMTLSGEAILSYWNMLGLVHTITVALASFTLALVVSKRRSIAFPAAIFGVCIFEGVMAFTSHFPLPQNLASTLWALLLAGVLWRSSNRRSVIPLLIIGSLALVLTHFVLGIVAASLLIAASLIFWASTTRFFTTHQKYISMAIIATILVCIVGSYAIDLTSINRGEAIAFSFTFSEKLTYFWQMFGLLPLLLIPAVWSIFQKYQFQMLAKKIVLLIFIGLMTMLLSGIPYSFKFLTLLHFPLVVLLALGLAWLLSALPRWTPAIVSIVLGVMLLTVTASRWQAPLLVDGAARHVSMDDLQAAEFLQKNFDETTLIISDPSTQYILEGLSGINSAGGAFADQHVRQVLRDQYEQNKIDPNALITITDKTIPGPASRVLVLSGRTYDWFMLEKAQQQALDFNIWRPNRLSVYDQAISELLITEQNLPILYRNPSYIMVQIK